MNGNMNLKTSSKLNMPALDFLANLGVPDPQFGVAIGDRWCAGKGQQIPVFSPINGEEIATVHCGTTEDVDRAVELASAAFQNWRSVPAPQRGHLVRQIGEELRKQKGELAYLVTLECGKIYQEALGEVQEMIDICDFALGLSRQLYGLSIVSERPMHRLTEQWHPLGPVGVISAFNFPVAVWAWNAMIALVCGDPVVWKPSEKTPLTAMACHAIAQHAISQFDFADRDLLHLVVGKAEIGNAIAAHRDLPLISATGSYQDGQERRKNRGRTSGAAVAGTGRK